jgi:hypothetical protein
LPVTAEIQEGYRLLFSPLMSIDRETVDVVLKCNIDQVEQLKNVTIDLPYPNGQFQPVQINVPQVASWRLHERFQWPANQVLLLSCGVIAAPAGTANNTLLGQGSGLLGLDRLVPGAAAGDRADALLMIEHKGNASTHLLSAPTPNSASSSTSPSISRGRY